MRSKGNSESCLTPLLASKEKMTAAVARGAGPMVNDASTRGWNINTPRKGGQTRYSTRVRQTRVSRKGTFETVNLTAEGDSRQRLSFSKEEDVHGTMKKMGRMFRSGIH